MFMRFRQVFIFFTFFSIFLFFGIIFSQPIYAETIYVNSDTGNDDTGDGSVGSPYATFNKAYTEAIADDTINLSGTFDWTDADETGDASTSGYTISKNLTIQGDTAETTIIQAASADNTGDRRVFTIGASVSTTIQNLTMRYGKSTGSGGCIYTNTGSNTTLRHVEMYNCRTTGSGGGAIYNFATTTIENSALYNNVDDFAGGAVYSNGFPSTSYIEITNTTIYGNTNTGGFNLGGGVFIDNSVAVITNSTITGNHTVGSGGGLVLYDTNGLVYLRNTIIAENTAVNSIKDTLRFIDGTITSNGYNILGSYSGFTLGVLDWSDTDVDGTYILNGVGTTGNMNFDTGLSNNDNPNKTKTLGLLSGSIAINTGTSTAHQGVSVPLIDQRGATLAGAHDIGAFEYDGGGLTITAPTIQASNITTSTVEATEMTISWTNGNGSRRVVFMKAAETGTSTPVDGTNYTANSVFGSGDQIGATGWYAVFDGLTTSTTVTGLTAGTEYRIQVIEYNGISDGTATYLTDTESGNPITQETHTPITIYCNASTGNDDTGTGASGAPYKTFDACYEVAKDGDTLDLTGIFDWNTDAEDGDNSITGYTISKDITISGQKAGETIIQASSTENTADRRIFTIGDNTSTTIKLLTLRYGKSSANGGCINTGVGTIVTLQYVEIKDCRTSANGGGLYSQATTTVYGASIHGNIAATLSGGGISSYQSGASPYIEITNSTIYDNEITGGWNAGGGAHIRNGVAVITNSVFTQNTAPSATGAGFYVYNSGGDLPVVYIRNSIFAENNGSGNGRDIYRQGGTVTNNGYNVLGEFSGFSATTGDWTDGDDDGEFDANDSAATGTLNMADTADINLGLFGVPMFEMTTGSITVDNGTSTAHQGVSVPTIDQRGASTSSTKDIGVFELAGVFSTSYTVTYIPGYGGSITGDNVQTITHGADATTVTATPATGYEFSSWSDGITSTSRTDTTVTSTLSFVATFTTSSYTITYLAGDNGSLTGSTTQSILYTGSGSPVTAVANTGYEFSRWSDDSTDNPRTDINVTASASFTAIFTAVAEEGGSSNPGQGGNRYNQENPLTREIIDSWGDQLSSEDETQSREDEFEQGEPTGPVIPIDEDQDFQCSSEVYVSNPVRFGAANNPRDVRLLEEFLNTYENAGLEVNGVYDQADFDAVVAWQEKYASDILAPWGLTQGTGYVYTTSLAKIKVIHEANCATAVPAQPETSAPTVPGGVQCLGTTEALVFGMNNADVVIAQQLLKNLGYFPEDVNTTGYFGPITQTAVIEFQAANGIDQVGIIGPQTRARLNELGC